MRRSVPLACLVLLCIGQTETVQFFLAGEEACYGTDTTLILCEAVNGCGHGVSGWTGEVLMECYRDGELYYRCGVEIVFNCTEIRRTPDLDGDGDVDLADFGRMATEWTGPR